ncbi:MAG TPA: hypothetical protein VGN25_07545 [Solirubrobacteraceae bacterium]|nr:hypothetical protein [Solirubrobacteraceae bacterium]
MVALVLALPWYLHELSDLRVIEHEATQPSSPAAGRLSGVSPPRLSATNLEWYLWNLVNAQLRPGKQPPCVQLDDGTGIWVRLGYPFAPGARDYCPAPGLISTAEVDLRG